MPVSTSIHISTGLGRILRLEPRSVLDVGMGFGLWGFLCREYFDVFNGRVQPDEWQTRIDGIELFEPYIQAHQRALYSSIIIGDIRKLAPNLDNYDLIIAGDVIEHLEKGEGEAVLETLYEKAVTALLVNIPIGGGWEHEEQYGNPGELHRSEWYVEDFAPYPSKADIYQLPCGKYGTFYCPKDCPFLNRVKGMIEAAEFYVDRGDLPRALKHIRRAYALAPGEPVVAMTLADILIRTQAPDEALRVLRKTVEADPGFHEAYVLSARLLASLARKQEALQQLATLLALDGVDPHVRREAEALRSQLRA